MALRSVPILCLVFICVATATITHPGSNATAQTIPTPPVDQKLELEIDKLKTDIRLAYITTILGFVSGLIAVGTILVQRQTALKTQKQSETTNLELKVADFVMNSVGPTMARQRFDMFQDIYKHRLSNEFIEAVGKAIKQDSFPGTRRDQLRFELFKAMAAKADSPNAAADAFRSVFPTENLV